MYLHTYIHHKNIIAYNVSSEKGVGNFDSVRDMRPQQMAERSTSPAITSTHHEQIDKRRYFPQVRLMELSHGSETPARAGQSVSVLATFWLSC